MSPDELSRYQILLTTMQRELLERGPQKIEPNRTSALKDPGAEEDEQPLNEMMQVIASNRNRSAETSLRAINRALDKIRKNPDDFGLCEECEEDLPEGRLKAMPFTELCVECQGKQDKKKLNAARRSLLDFM